MKSYISRKLPLATRTTAPTLEDVPCPACTSGAPRDERQQHVARALRVHVDGVARHAPCEPPALGRAGVGIHVEVREVAGGHVEPDAVPAHETVGSWKCRDRDAAHLARLHERGMLE